jgi:hypothetical protein
LGCFLNAEQRGTPDFIGFRSFSGSARWGATSEKRDMSRRMAEWPEGPWDVPTLAIVASALIFAALMASFIPGRHPASTNPIEALRSE